MKKTFIITLISIIFISCVGVEKVNIIKNVSLPQVIQNKKAFEQHFNLSNIVVLETNESSLIQSLNRIIVHNEKIILLNNHMEVLVFDIKTGNFLSKIKRVGNGLGEYSKIIDIAFDNNSNQIIVYSDNGKVLFFNIDCNYIKDFKIGNELFESLVFKDGFLYFYNPLSTSRDLLIHIFDINKMEWTQQIGIKDVNFNVKLNGVPIVKSKSIWFANPLENYLSKVGENKIIYPYRINVNNFADKDKMIELQKNQQEFFKEINQNNIVYAFTSIKETSNFLYLKSNLHSLIWINKKTNKVEWINNIDDTRFGFANLKYFSHDCNDDKVLFLFEPYNLNDKKTTINKLLQGMNQKKSVKFSDFKEDANPILLFYSEK